MKNAAYEKCLIMCEYWNEYFRHYTVANVGFRRLNKKRLEQSLRENPVRTVEEFFAFLPSGSILRNQFAEHSLKVQRLNKLAALINADPGNVLLYKRVANEAYRLIYLGYRKKRFRFEYPGPNYHPDKLKGLLK